VRRCPVCGGPRRQAFRALVRSQFEGTFLTCAACGLLQAEDPDVWLREAHADPIVRNDTGLVMRNLALARRVTPLLYFEFDPAGRYCDLGGGTGLLVRLMRDLGFDYYWSDPHCPNTLAGGFELDVTRGPCELVSAFEVLEHVVDPLALLDDARQRIGARSFVVSTETFVGAPPPIDWWYYAFEVGQHISFYQPRTLDRIAARLGLRARLTRDLQLFTDRDVPPWRFRFLTDPRVAAVLSQVVRLRLQSRTATDSQALLGGRPIQP
jgi:hypothetical protein